MIEILCNILWPTVKEMDVDEYEIEFTMFGLPPNTQVHTENKKKKIQKQKRNPFFSNPSSIIINKYKIVQTKEKFSHHNII